MPTETPYTIADLSRLTGLNVRTIRSYLAQGLIPPSGESGPGAHYGEGHLARLRLTKRLQAQHLPLAEIRTQLATLSDDEVVEAEASTTPVAEPPSTSALDYVRGVLGAAEDRSTPAPGQLPASWSTPRVSRLARAAPSMSMPMPGPEPGPPAPEPPEPPALERSQWERLSLGPNVELHVRRPLSRLEQKRVERLITIARQVLKEDKP